MRAPAHVVEGSMRTPAQLREASRTYNCAARDEAEPHLKLGLARHALALAQLAERIERDAPPGIKRKEVAD